MKPMKKKTSKSKVVEESASTIKNYFKTAPNGQTNGRANGINVCMKTEKQRAFDNKAVYVQALKDRLKNFNGEPENENIDKECVATGNKITNIADDLKNRQTVYSSNGDLDQTNVNGTVVVDLGTDDVDHDIAAVLDGKSATKNTVKAAGMVNAATGNNVRNNHKGTGVVDLDIDEALVLDGKNANRLCDASCELLRKKYKDLKKEHYKLCQKHCEILMKYEQLVETLDAVHKAKSSVSDVCDVPLSTDGVFTSHQITILESLPLEKKKDSTFILQCIEYAYKDDTSSLVNKTLFGTLERKEFGDDGAVVVRPAKDPLTPEKVKRIEELFVKRVTKSKCLPAEFAERIVPTNINRLIASAIRNVSNKENPKKPQKNVNLNL